LTPANKKVVMVNSQYVGRVSGLEHGPGDRDSVLEAQMIVPPDSSLDAFGGEDLTGGVDELENTFESMDLTVRQATSAVDGLRDLLGRLEALAALARQHQHNEAKIGELFIRVQDYISRATAEAEEHALNLIAEAEFEAARIVATAKEEAHRLLSEARRPASLPPEAITQLQMTIDGFARLNNELLRELGTLNQTLLAHAQLQAVPPPQDAPLPPPPGPRVLAERVSTRPPESEPDHGPLTAIFHRTA
jgi:hypothetical protein